MTWISTEDSLPDEGQIVVALVGGEARLAVRFTEYAGHEDGYDNFLYWDDPINDGQDWQDEDVTHWMLIPELPKC